MVTVSMALAEKTGSGVENGDPALSLQKASGGFPYYFKKLYYGIGFGPVISSGGRNPFRFHSSAFLRHPVYHFIQGELALGLNGLSSSSADRIGLRSAEYKLLAGLRNLYDFDVWKPYLYAGFGRTRYQIWVPDFYGPRYESGLSYIPFGIGTYFRFQDLVAFDASLGYCAFLKPDANFKKHGPQGFLTLQIGISLVGSRDLSDWDHDGLVYRDERSFRSDPRNPDSDQDELSDWDEVSSFRTDPMNTDTDTDGITDKLEIATYKTDPLSADSDGDKLGDYEELHRYGTDPLQADSDDDELDDYAELMTYATNPLIVDTDGDSLWDGQEVWQYKTDPAKIDTDDGSVDDFAEVRRGSDPLDGSDDIIPRDKPIVLEGIFFEYKSTQVDTAASQVLKQVAASLREHAGIRVEIQGHTDNIGSRRYNIKLSNDRARSVRSYLMDLGVAAERMRAVGYGFDHPRATNETEAGRSQNRRIEFVRIDTDEQKAIPADELDFAVWPVGTTKVLENLCFAYKTTEISPESMELLEKISAELQQNPIVRLEIQGHSDNIGSRAYNLRISQKRAEAVRACLLQKGISEDRIIARGYAFDEPRASNATAEGRRRNRRIELLRIN